MPTWHSSRYTGLPTLQALILVETPRFCYYWTEEGPELDQLGSLTMSIFAQPVQGELEAPLPSLLAAWDQHLCLDLGVCLLAAS